MDNITVAAEHEYAYYTDDRTWWSDEVFDLLCPKCKDNRIIILAESGLAWQRGMSTPTMLGVKAQCWLCKHEFVITGNCWKCRVK